jgi:SAM-dependent methyltransferase
LYFIGTDISSCGISLAKDKIGMLNNVIFLVDDIEHSKIKSESVSLIISQSVLEHLINYEAALNECYRILKPGGKLLIRVGNGGRSGGGLTAFVKDFFSYLFGLNKIVYLNPSFDLTGKADEKEKKHKTNFDLLEIPSNILIRSLRNSNFTVSFFSTFKEAILMGDRYKAANSFLKILIEFYVNLNIYPFNHLGYTTIILAIK